MRYPLDSILGTRSAVAVVRALSMSGAPLSQAELARRGGLHLRGLPATLATLEAAGIVSFVGRGRTRQVQLYHRHPLIEQLRQLFQLEANRFDAVVQRLKTIGPHVGCIASWIEGAMAEGTDTFSDPINATLLFDGLPSPDTQAIAQQQANDIQSEQHVIVALRFHQRADLLRFTADRRAALAHAIVLSGPAPTDLVEAAAPAKRDEEQSPPLPDIGDQPLALAQMVAARIAKDPELVVLARNHVDRRLAMAGATERLTLLEWKGLLESLTPRQLAALLREDSERADRLRTSLPFIGVLSSADRAAKQ